MVVDGSQIVCCRTAGPKDCELSVTSTLSGTWRCEEASELGTQCNVSKDLVRYVALIGSEPCSDRDASADDAFAPFEVCHCRRGLSPRGLLRATSN